MGGGAPGALVARRPWQSGGGVCRGAERAASAGTAGELRRQHANDALEPGVLAGCLVGIPVLPGPAAAHRNDRLGVPPGRRGDPGRLAGHAPDAA